MFKNISTSFQNRYNGPDDPPKRKKGKVVYGNNGYPVYIPSNDEFEDRAQGYKNYALPAASIAIGAPFLGNSIRAMQAQRAITAANAAMGGTGTALTYGSNAVGSTLAAGGATALGVGAAVSGEKPVKTTYFNQNVNPVQKKSLSAAPFAGSVFEQQLQNGRIQKEAYSPYVNINLDANGEDYNTQKVAVRGTVGGEGDADLYMKNNPHLFGGKSSGKSGAKKVATTPKQTGASYTPTQEDIARANADGNLIRNDRQTQDLSINSGVPTSLGKNLNGSTSFNFDNNSRRVAELQKIENQQLKSAGQQSSQKVDQVAYDGTPAPNNSGSNGGERGKFGIHDAATVFNLGMAVRNMGQPKPGYIHLNQPTANNIQKDTRQITNAQDKANSQINAGVSATQKSQRGVGATLSAASLGNAARLRGAAATGGQIAQYTTAVDNQNTQINNQVAAQRAGIKNQETQLNANIQAQDAATRGQIVTSNVQGAIQNQNQKLQEKEFKKQADMNRLIQVEAMKGMVERDAFASQDYSDFLMKRKGEIRESIMADLGDVTDITNPKFKDALTGSEAAFDKDFKSSEGFKAIQSKIETIQGKIDGSEAGTDVTGYTDEIASLNTGLEETRGQLLESYQGELVQKYYDSEIEKRFKTESTGLQDEYRQLRGIEKSDISSLLKMFKTK